MCQKSTNPVALSSTKVVDSDYPDADLRKHNCCTEPPHPFRQGLWQSPAAARPFSAPVSTSDTQSDEQNQDLGHDSVEGIANGFGGCGSKKTSAVCKAPASCKIMHARVHTRGHGWRGGRAAAPTALTISVTTASVGSKPPTDMQASAFHLSHSSISLSGLQWQVELHNFPSGIEHGLTVWMLLPQDGLHPRKQCIS